MSDDELIRSAKAGNVDAIQLLLARCHDALMKVWNRYREGIHRRGINTSDALLDLTAIVVKNIGSFRDETVGQFCAWSRTIFRRWILTQLRLKIAPNLPSSFDLIDADEQPPDLDRDKQLKRAAYVLAELQLSELDQLLIDLRIYKALSWEAMPAAIETARPDLWEQHQETLKTAYLVEQAFDEAFKRLHREARRIYEMLQDPPPPDAKSS